MKKIGTQKVNINSLYSYPFQCPILEIPYIKMVEQELRYNPSMQKSEYYLYLKEKLASGVKVFGSIETEEQLRNRYKKWKKLIVDIGKEYKSKKEYKIQNGLPYDGITAILKEEKMLVVDGHHRLAILHGLGYKEVEVMVFSKEYYQDKYKVKDKLDRIDYDWNNKSVLDVGCNVGEVYGYLKNKGVSYIGIDANENYIQEAKRRRKDVDYRIMSANKSVKDIEVDVVLALGVLHHLTDEQVKEFIKDVKGDLIFEVPVLKEGEEIDTKHGYRVRSRRWYLEVLKKYSAIETGHSGMALVNYPHDRINFVCRKETEKGSGILI